MAGDWIKMRCDLPEDPDVIALAAAVGIEEDTAVGKLLRFWRWISAHTIDGNARGVTPVWIDRYVGATGFADALEAVGWLEVTAEGLTVPDFERYLSEGAKTRALTAKRASAHRAKSNASGVTPRNGGGVTKSAPREEKRREEKKQESASCKGESKAQEAGNAPTLPLWLDQVLYPDGLDCAETREALAGWFAWKEARGRPALDPALEAAALLRCFGTAAEVAGSVAYAVGNQCLTLKNYAREHEGRQGGKAAGAATADVRAILARKAAQEREGGRQ